MLAVQRCRPPPSQGLPRGQVLPQQRLSSRGRLPCLPLRQLHLPLHHWPTSCPAPRQHCWALRCLGLAFQLQSPLLASPTLPHCRLQPEAQNQRARALPAALQAQSKHCSSCRSCHQQPRRRLEGPELLPAWPARPVRRHLHRERLDGPVSQRAQPLPGRVPTRL